MGAKLALMVIGKSKFPRTIQNCYRHTGFDMEDYDVFVVEEPTENQHVEQHENFNGVTFEEYLNVDVVLTTTVTPTIRDIAEQLQERQATTGEADDTHEDEDHEAEEVPTSAETNLALRTVFAFVGAAEGDAYMIPFLNKLEEFIRKTEAQSARQTQITSYFTVE